MKNLKAAIKKAEGDDRPASEREKDQKEAAGRKTSGPCPRRGGRAKRAAEGGKYETTS